MKVIVHIIFPSLKPNIITPFVTFMNCYHFLGLVNFYNNFRFE